MGVAVEFGTGASLAPEVKLSAVQQDWRAAEHIMKKDDAPPSEDELISFADANPEVLQVGALRASRAVVLAAVRRDGLALRYATRTWRADREVVLEAMRQNTQAIFHASMALQQDYELSEMRRCASAREGLARQL